VGGYFGARLARAGHDVAFIARGAHLEAIHERGLTIESILGNFVIQPARASDNPAEIGPADVVLVGVKAWQVAEAARAIRPLVGPDTLVVPLQNGVDAPYELAAELDEVNTRPHAIGGLCRIVSLVAGPGVIRHAGMDPSIAFNRLDGAPDERVQALAEAFKTAGVTCEVPADIVAALWAKFAFIAGFGGVGAVTRVPAGVLRSLPETRGMLESAIREVVMVARARKVRLTDEVVARTLAAVDALPEGGTASMQRDIMAGRPSELESQTGSLVRLGREAGVNTPTHDFIYASLLPQETLARK
jgi:2-dehydropantoate 2-reductase